MPFCRRILLSLCTLALSAPLLTAEPSPAANDAGNLVKAGKEAIKKGRYDEAVALLSQALAANAQLTEAYTRRALAYAALNKADEALKDMAEALKLEPANRNHLADRARVFEVLTRFDEAIADCTTALAMKNDSNILLLRAQLYAKKGDYARAIADYTQVLAQQPMRADLYIARAQLHRLIGQVKEAGEDFGKAARLNPSYAATVHRLASQPASRSSVVKPTLAQVAPPATTAAAPSVPSPSAAQPTMPAPVAAPEAKLVVKKADPKRAAASPKTMVASERPPAPQPAPVKAPEPEPLPEPEPPKPDPAALKAAAEAQQVTAAISAGRAQLDAKQWPEAVNTYTTLLQLRPKNADAWLRRCMAHHFSGNHKAAIEDCTKTARKLLNCTPSQRPSSTGHARCTRKRSFTAPPPITATP
jgi:tetratricopeptide (TPR) repeat protein